VLIGLWLLSQLNRKTLLFGTGDPARAVPRAFGKALPRRVSCAWKSRGRVRERLWPARCSSLPVLPGQPVRVSPWHWWPPRSRCAARLRLLIAPSGFGLGHTPAPSYGTASESRSSSWPPVFREPCKWRSPGRAPGGEPIATCPPANPSSPHASLWQQGTTSSQRRDGAWFPRVPFAAMFTWFCSPPRTSAPDLTGSQPARPL